MAARLKLLSDCFLFFVMYADILENTCIVGKLGIFLKIMSFQIFEIGALL